MIFLTSKLSICHAGTNSVPEGWQEVSLIVTPRGSKTHHHLFYTLKRRYKRIFRRNLDTNRSFCCYLCHDFEELTFDSGDLTSVNLPSPRLR